MSSPEQDHDKISDLLAEEIQRMRNRYYPDQTLGESSSAVTEEPKKSGGAEKLKKLVAIAALGAVAAGGTTLAVNAIKAENAKNHRHDVALEKVIKPTAEKIAQYVMEHKKWEPSDDDDTYHYTTGTYADGKTTIDVDVRKIDGKAPSAADVTSVYIIDWKKPGSDGRLGDYASYGMLLEGSTWTATEQVDAKKPYGDEGGIGYSSIQGPMDFRTASEILSDARTITHDTMEHFQEYRDANGQ